MGKNAHINLLANVNVSLVLKDKIVTDVAMAIGGSTLLMEVDVNVVLVAAQLELLENIATNLQVNVIAKNGILERTAVSGFAESSKH